VIGTREPDEKEAERARFLVDIREAKRLMAA
jgi:hypothetical protein